MLEKERMINSIDARIKFIELYTLKFSNACEDFIKQHTLIHCLYKSNLLSFRIHTIGGSFRLIIEFIHQMRGEKDQIIGYTKTFSVVELLHFRYGERFIEQNVELAFNHFIYDLAE